MPAGGSVMHRGEVRSLLFVHGAAHRAQCWDDHFLPYFVSRGYRVAAVSMRDGYVETAARATESVGRRLTRIRQAAEVLGDPVLVGHGAGGLLVQEYRQRYQSSGAVLLGNMPSLGGLQTMMRATGLRSMVFAGYTPHAILARCYAECDDTYLRAFCPAPADSSADAGGHGAAPVLVIEADGDDVDGLLHSAGCRPVLERMDHWLRATHRRPPSRQCGSRPSPAVEAPAPTWLSRTAHLRAPGGPR